MARNYEDDEWELSGGENSEDDYDNFDEWYETAVKSLCDIKRNSSKEVNTQKKKLYRKAADAQKKKPVKNVKSKTISRRKSAKLTKGVNGQKKSNRQAAQKRNVDQIQWKTNKSWKPVPNFDNVEIVATFEHENNTSPLFYFKQFFTDAVWQLIVDETNRYAIQQKSNNWSEVTIEEMQAFAGMVILMGVNNLPVIDLYWSTNPLFYNQIIANVMTCKRFKKILENIHLNDNEKMPKRGDVDFDKLYKIRPFLNQMSSNFVDSAIPTKSQSIDESMILFTGRSAIKQYMPKKPKIRRGYKVWSRCDSQTGYLYQFEIYTGKRDDKVTEKGLGPNVVKRLCAALEGSDTHVAFDNFFTTVELMPDLYQSKVYSTGTVKSNRKGLPQEARQNNKMERGEFIWKVKDNVGFVQWMDTKQVNVLSTAFHPSILTKVSRTQKDGKKVDIPCPVVIAEYTKRMGGVDRFDQKRLSYTVGRRSRRWWLRIFYFFIDAALTNSLVLYSTIPRTKNKQLSHLNFQVAVGNQLIGRFCSRKDKLPSFNVKRARASTKDFGVDDDIRFSNVGAHMPKELPTPRRCRLCSSKVNNKRSKIECSECKVPLCVASCFADFHCQ